MSATRTSDCRKFSPNIFNKSKCSHCFRQREEHSAAALECNRASRKVSKCGYLFVAPDWDFSNPLYRTKRWQRRWFVLYDDGELTYSVDEHPETVPQACIDMTKVLEVTTAEDVTGHTNSIAITAPDRVTFVKGTCPEESKWWLNILAAFPKSKGRHKRNATFPGGQATTILQAGGDTSGTAAVARNRHNSYHKDALTSAQSAGVLIGSTGASVVVSGGGGADDIWRQQHGANDDDDEDDEDGVDDDEDDEEDDGVETGEDEDVEDVVGSSGNGDDLMKSKSSTHSGGQDENNRNAGNEITNRVSPSSCLLIEDIRRDEKTIKDIANTITNLSQQQKSRWSTTAVNNVLNSHIHQRSHMSNNDDKNSRDETDFQRVPHTNQQQQQSSQQQQQTTIVSLRPKSLSLAANSTPAIVSAIVKKIPPVLVSSASPTTTSSSAAGDNNSNNNKSSLSSIRCKSSPRLQLQLKHLQQQHQNNRQQKHMQQQTHERGDPDGGCNLDDLSSNYLAKTAELRVNVPVEESLNTKKGWLMKQDNRTGDWTKHWFTLSGAALFYYRDPVSEERGVLDGVLDVNSLTNVAEVNTSKNYAFQLTTWDKRRLTLASLSPNSRNSWIAVLRNAAGLQSTQANSTSSATTSVITKEATKSVTTTAELIIKDNSSDDIKSEIEKDFIKAQRNQELLTSSLKEKNNNVASKNNKLKDSLNNNTSNKMLTDTSPQVIITNTSTAPKITPISPITPSTPKTAHFSSDEEYRTASEGGRRDSVDWGSPLSPSPPIPLSLLRAKERMRSRTVTNCPSLHKRSRSSPPSSRRSTVDSVVSDDLPVIHSVQEELNIDKELQFRLSVAEKERDMLRDEAKEREARMSDLLMTLERTEHELNARVHEMEEARSNLTMQLTEAKCNAEKIIDRLSDELDESHKNIKQLEDRLTRGIEENETLYKRLRELESCSPSSFNNLNRCKLKRMDSLSDLTHINDIDAFSLERDMLAEEYNELRTRFEKAVNEIKAMKRELKESQNQFDALEINYASLKQDLERKEVEDRAQLQMMAERIQDLTLKYSGSERQVRTLKQKLAKSERRRSLSLKGKEQLTISKELEVKVTELETKIDELEKSAYEINRRTAPLQAETSSSKQSTKKSSRRRSLETSASADSLQFMVRVNDLEKRFDCVTTTSSVSSSSTTTPAPTPTLPSTPTHDGSPALRGAASPKVSEHLIERLRCLEGVLVASKDRLEQSLHQLQTLRSSRTRRSVSPITDRKDSYRFVERCLSEVVKLMRESCETCIVAGSLGTGPGMLLLPESSPIKVALMQLEAQLRNKLADLLKQRRVLRERNELTSRKDLELLAERVAFESVCFGKLRDSVSRAENPQLFGERQTRTEVAETSHLITMLKAKLSGKCAFKPSGSVDILAGVLARRLVLSGYRKDTQSNQGEMEPVDKNILDDLLRQQNEINLISKRYKNNAMENLAAGLAAETLSYISSNDLVQGAVQEAWRQAQETVNAELVQSEIAHIMMRNAERFENSITPSFGYTLTAEERLTFENFADAVHDALRKEMELAVAQLTHCYDEAIITMKRGQWRLHLEQERKASEGRQLLAEFADIIAHKALVDARIAVLCGDYSGKPIQIEEETPNNHMQIGITALQKYENLFEELSNDLQISNPDDILAEADFEFMYKQQTVDFLSDRQVLSEISTFLGQLEDSLIALQCEAVSTTSISRSAISIESLQDVCHKCCDLRQRADQLLQDVQHKLNTPCQHCHQVRDKLCDLQQQHESELLRMQQTHAKDMNLLLQQLENQRNVLKSLESERQELNSNLHKHREFVEQREHELNAVQNKLQIREDELQRKQHDKLELQERLNEQDDKLQAYQEESDALTMKCARQDEEYAVLLQERDYLQAELGKEQERSRRYEKRLEMLELEHGKQLDCLQEAYREQILSHCTDFSNLTDEESFRQRYQAEIEQLRTLCEKGLSAMESSHRRIINDLEEKHRQEIERLLMEKETALAEETQATLAALDAMRKAHQSEVQREVARFKQEFLRQFQKGEHTADGVKVKEEDLDELRHEILSFSEKYSIKCVENAALEEKLRSANQKLKHFQQMQQLELRNKQFRAHLASDNPLTDAKFVQGLAASKDDATCQDSEPTKITTHAMPKEAQPIPSDPCVTTLEQSFFVIPPATLLCQRTTHNSNEKVIIDNAASYTECDSNHRYSYEPCYQQNKLYSYQNRISFEGLKPTTFGKNLKTISKSLKPATSKASTAVETNVLALGTNTTAVVATTSTTQILTLTTTTPASTTFLTTPTTASPTTVMLTAPTSAASPATVMLTTPSNVASPTAKALPTALALTSNLASPTAVMLISKASPTTLASTTISTTLSSPASSTTLNQQQTHIATEQQQQQQKFKNTATIQINVDNTVVTTASEQINYNNYKQYLQRQQMLKQQQTCSLKLDALTTNPVEEPKNISNKNNHIKKEKENEKTSTNLTYKKNINLTNIKEQQQQNEHQALQNKLVNDSEKTTTAATITSLKIAEKSAICLESFTEFMKRTVNEKQQQIQQTATLEVVEHDDVGDAVQQQQQHMDLANKTTTTTTNAAALTVVSTLGSPPPLSGRDVEQQRTAAVSKATTSHLRRFELDI